VTKRNSAADRLGASDLKALLELPFDRGAWEAIASEHLHLRIGNDPPSTERGEALDRLQTFLSRLAAFGCRYRDLWQRREAIYAETDVRFRDAEGRLREIPCALVARVVGGRLLDLRLHLDPSPIP